MLFYLNQFELHLPESSLKKGLAMLNNLEVHKLDSPNKYNAHGIEICVQIKNNQLHSYKCTCQKSKYCEHLAAVLFFLQEQKLPLHTLPLGHKTKKNASPTISNIEALQQIIYKASLVDFTKKSKTKANYFDAFLNLLKTYLKPYQSKIPLTQNQINLICKALQDAQQLILTNKQKELIFDWYLALTCFFIYLNDFRFSGNENKLVKIKEETENALNKCFEKGLDALQKQSWQKAALFSIQSNKFIKSKVFYFFIPRLIILSKKQDVLQKIEALIKNRIYAKPYDEPLNHLEIIKHQLFFKFHKVPKKVNFESDELIEPEYLISLYEYHFLSNKIDKAFELLNTCLVHFQKKQIILLRLFTFYAIEKSRYYQLNDKELQYLQMSFIYNLQINEDELSRFMKLLPIKKQTDEINALISHIKTTNSPFAFEKISKLLITTNNHEALLKLLLQEKNKFNLLHQTILMVPKKIDEPLLKVYAKQLGTALQQANTFTRQKQLIVQCKDLFELISQEKTLLLFNLILNETGYESQIGKFTLSEFEIFSLTSPNPPIKK